MKPVILDAARTGETPPLRWRILYDQRVVVERAFGIMVFGGPEWAIHLYVGDWLIGIERTREEDD